MIMITPFIEVRNTEAGFESTQSCNRVFTNAHFDANQIIVKFTPTRMFSKSEVISQKHTNGIISNTEELLQISKDLYLDLTGDITKFIKHSCNANTSIKILSRSAFLMSKRSIKPNEELTFDYSITSDETPDTWQMHCKCGAWNCRKTISGFNTLSEKDRQIFLAQGIVPKYISK